MALSKQVNRALVFALLILYTFSQLYLVSQTLECSLSPVFPFWVLLLCMTSWLTASIPYGLLVGLPASVFVLIFASRRFPADLSLQLNDILDRITGVYVEHFMAAGESYPYLQSVPDHDFLLILFAFLLASYMAACLTSRSSRIGLALLGALPFSIGCLIVNEKPSVLCVLGLVLFLALLAVSGPQYQESSNSWRSVLLALIPFSLLFALLVWLIQPSEYSFEPQPLELSDTFEALEQRLDDWMNERFALEGLPYSSDSSTESSQGDASKKNEDILWQNGNGALDLTQNSSEDDLNREFLRIRPMQDGSYYLRAVSYGDYIGTGWLPADETTGSSSLGFSAEAMLAAGAREARLPIQDLAALKYRCLPYFSTEVRSFDSFVPASIASSYTAEYVSLPDQALLLQIPAQLVDAEESYRLYAHRVYTALPEDTRYALQNVCQNVGLSAENGDIITEVARYVQSSGVYDVSTEAYPSSDYAVYFLTEAHRGYCIHFATAAAALYRTLGIPARITEGFLITAKGGEATVVRGENAHAWVEVYQDGLGWLPVEVTGQSGLNSAPAGANIPEPSSEPTQSETSETQSPSQLQKAPPTPMPVGLVTDTASPSASSGAALSYALYRILFVLICLAGLSALVLLRRLLLLRWRLYQYTQRNTKKAVIYMYRMAERAAVFGQKIPVSLQRTAEKAAFSAHPITEEERLICQNELEELLSRCQADLRFWKKLRFLYLYVLK